MPITYNVGGSNNVNYNGDCLPSAIVSVIGCSTATSCVAFILPTTVFTQTCLTTTGFVCGGISLTTSAIAVVGCAVSCCGDQISSCLKEGVDKTSRWIGSFWPHPQPRALGYETII